MTRLRGRNARLVALGEYRPTTVLTNAELCAQLDTTDEWIVTRTGIRSRHRAGPDESVVAMAAAAAEKALAAAGLPPVNVQLVVLATCSIRNPIPAGAPLVASMIGAAHAGAFDLNAACGGFCYALGAAADMVAAGSVDHAVVIGAERMTDWVDQTDRSTAILFGDGAAAAVLASAAQPGVGPTAWGSDGAAADLVGVPAGEELLRMRGPALFRWITERLPAVAREACDRAGIEPADLAALIPHQANLRIVDALARALQLPAHVVVARDVVDTGNTSSASVPLALCRLIDSGALSSGQHALLLSVGAGLTYASQVVTVP